MSTKSIILLLLGIITYSISYSQISSTQIDSLVEKAMEELDVIGCAISVVKDGETIHEKGYGYQSMDSKQPVDPNTIFGIASNSKAFTATALAILVDQGKITWDDKVVKHIPEFKMYDDYVTKNFTIKDLLTHSSGLGSGAGDLMTFPDGGNFEIKDLLNCFQYFEPESDFRVHFNYNNLLYIVAGELIKRVSGKRWGEFITDHIFQPLQMNNTYPYIDRIADKSNLTKAHTFVDNKHEVIPYWKTTFNGAAGGIHSTVNDMSKWMLAQLNNGIYGDNLSDTLFTSESQREMWNIHTSLKPSPNPRNNTHFYGYGLGWFVSDIRGNLLVFHTGGMPGMVSKVVLIPDLNLGIVVLTNTSENGGFLFETITNTICDSYLGLEEMDWLKIMKQASANYLSLFDTILSNVSKKITLDYPKEINPTKFIGIYKDSWFGKIEIYSENNQLKFKSYRSPNLKGTLYHYIDNTFVIKWDIRNKYVDAFAYFEPNEIDNILRLKMERVIPDSEFCYDFQDLNLEKVK